MDGDRGWNRRAFLGAALGGAIGAGTGAGAGFASSPSTFAILGARKGRDGAAVVGEGDHVYECDHAWGRVPDHIRWYETHGIAVDGEGLVYVTHRAGPSAPASPDAGQDTVAVFEPDGTFVRSFGRQWHGGGHGVDVRKEGNQEFLYLAFMFPVNLVVKTDLRGEVVWIKTRADLAPSRKYDEESARFSPTNIAFGPEGGFYVADGYGSNYIHQFDKDGEYVRTWGGTGEGIGQFKTPHGIWLDDRPGREPAVVVADRANARLQYFGLDGTPMPDRTSRDVSFPAHFDTRGDLLLVPDLHARITLMDKDNKVSTHLGYDPDWTAEVLDGFKVRVAPDRWRAGRFVHPHDACFDKDGNILVAEWVVPGRLTKLTRKS